MFIWTLVTRRCLDRACSAPARLETQCKAGVEAADEYEAASARRGVGDGDGEGLAPDEDGPGAVLEVDPGGDVVELGAPVAAQVAEADAALGVLAVLAGDEVEVVVGAGLDVDVLEADDVASVRAAGRSRPCPTPDDRCPRNAPDRSRCGPDAAGAGEGSAGVDAATSACPVEGGVAGGSGAVAGATATWSRWSERAPASSVRSGAASPIGAASSAGRGRWRREWCRRRPRRSGTSRPPSRCRRPGTPRPTRRRQRPRRTPRRGRGRTARAGRGPPGRRASRVSRPP